MLNSFVKKPVLETDLKTQMNLALGKESRKEAIHEDNCTGVTIVLGEDGSRIRLLGTEARKDMETLFDSKVMLSMWVKVKKGWSDDERAMRRLGYLD